MSTIASFIMKHKNKIKLPILNSFSNKIINDESISNILETKKIDFNKNLFSNSSRMENHFLYTKKNSNNKISSIPIASNKSNKINKNNNIYILKNINFLNKNLRKNNSNEILQVYQINESNKIKIFENYSKYNFYYNTFFNKFKYKKKLKAKNKIRNILYNDEEFKNQLNKNKSQENYFRNVSLNKIKSKTNQTNISNLIYGYKNKSEIKKIYKDNDKLNNCNFRKNFNIKFNNKKLSMNLSNLNDDLISKEENDNDVLIKSNGRFNKNNSII